MKKCIAVLSCILLVCSAFSQEAKDTAKKPAQPMTKNGRVLMGTVMHRDNKHCSTVIRVVSEDKKDTSFYIPMGDSLKGFNKPGTNCFQIPPFNDKEPAGL